MSVSGNENFMSRWSRRKQEVALESEAEASGKIAEGVSNNNVESTDKNEDASHQQAVSEQTPEEIREEKLAELNALTDEDMPDVETLSEDSDYAGFMSVNVSESLRKIALQKLFHGKSYNIRDGLDEYDGDYTSFEKLDPSIITADMKHMIDVEAKKLLVKEEEDSLDEDHLDEENQDVASSDIDDVSEELDDELDVASNNNVSEAVIESGHQDKEKNIVAGKDISSNTDSITDKNNVTNKDMA